MPSAREDDLIIAVLDTLQQRAIQLNSEEPQLATEFMTAVGTMIDTFQNGDIPRDCLSLFRQVEKLKAEWDDFEMYVSPKEPRPRNPFWLILNEIENELTYAPPQVNDVPTESVAELKKQGVTDYQICTIYGHEGKGPFMKNGLPQPHLVRAEMARPGSIIPKEFEHPRLAGEREKAAKYRNPVAQRASELREERSARIIEEAAPPAPIGAESIEELLLAGVPEVQIVKIKQCTMAEIGEAKLRVQAQQNGEPSPAELADLNAQIVEWIGANPDAKNAEIAEAIGCGAKLVAKVRLQMGKAAKEGANA